MALGGWLAAQALGEAILYTRPWDLYYSESRLQQSQIRRTDQITNLLCVFNSIWDFSLLLADDSHLC